RRLTLGAALGTALGRLPALAALRRLTAGAAAVRCVRGRLPSGAALAAAVRHPSGLRLGGGVDRDVDAEAVALLEGAVERRQLLLPAVGEHVVALEGDPVEVLGGAGVAVEGVHLAGLRLGQGDLGGEDRVAGVHDRLGVREHLEVDVGPAPGIAAGDDAGEGHRAVRIGDLHPAQVGLVLQALAVERVVPGGIAVPQVHRRALHGDVPTRHVDDDQGDLEGCALGRGVRVDARADVAALHPAGLEHVRAVGAVPRVGAGGLAGHLLEPRGAGAPGIARPSPVARRAARGTLTAARGEDG